jgi:hypothetical protein
MGTFLASMLSSVVIDASGPTGVVAFTTQPYIPMHGRETLRSCTEGVLALHAQCAGQSVPGVTQPKLRYVLADWAQSAMEVCIIHSSLP